MLSNESEVAYDLPVFVGFDRSSCDESECSWTFLPSVHCGLASHSGDDGDFVQYLLPFADEQFGRVIIVHSVTMASLFSISFVLAFFPSSGSLQKLFCNPFKIWK